MNSAYGVALQSITNTSILYLNSTENSTSVEERLDPPKRYFILAMLFVSVVGLVGNAMVIIAVKTVNKLQNDTNKILCSLATADLLVCLLVMPPSAGQLAMGSWEMGDTSCSMFIFLDVCLCTASIMHMCAISVERCIGVIAPLANRTCPRKSMILVLKLVVVWMYSIGTALPVFVISHTDKQHIYVGRSCILNQLAFQISASLFAFYIPVSIMTVAHILTTRILVRGHRLNKKHSGNGTLRRVQGFKVKKTLPCKQEEEGLNTSEGTNSEFQTIHDENDDSQSTYRSRSPTGSNRMSPCLEKYSLSVPKCNLNVIEERKLYIGVRLSQKGSHQPVQAKNYQSVYHQKARTRNKKKYKSNAKKSTRPPIAKKLPRRVSRLMEFRTNRKSTQNGRVSREIKASNVLKLVFIAFLVCWSPFFVLNMISAICENRCINSPVLMDIALWLGYCSSIVNPIIYTIINKEFQQAFKNILMCRICVRPRNVSIERANSASNGGSFRENRRNAILITNYGNGSSKHVIERSDYREALETKAQQINALC